MEVDVDEELDHVVMTMRQEHVTLVFGHRARETVRDHLLVKGRGTASSNALETTLSSILSLVLRTSSVVLTH